jgi:large subunit ribosomal protein L9
VIADPIALTSNCHYWLVKQLLHPRLSGRLLYGVWRQENYRLQRRGIPYTKQGLTLCFHQAKGIRIGATLPIRQKPCSQCRASRVRGRVLAATELILLERVQHLGSLGDVVRVRPGYARNFLLPKGKAVRATKLNLESFRQQRGRLEAQNSARRESAQRLAERFGGLEVIIIRQANESGNLYGAVTARDIADTCGATGLTITRQQIKLDPGIRALGLSVVQVWLHPEVVLPVVVNVARSFEEAERQAYGEGDRPSQDEEAADPDSRFGARGEVPPDIDMMPALLARLSEGSEGSRVNALNKLARFVLEEQDTGQRDVKPIHNSVRSIPGKLLDALIREADSEHAGKAAAVALACFLAPDRYRGTDLDRVDESDFARTIQQGLRARGLGYFSIVNVIDRGPSGAKVHAALRNSFGFRLAGQPLELEAPDWLDCEKGLEILTFGLAVTDLTHIPKHSLSEGTLAACTALLTPEPNCPERVSIYLKNGETVFDRFVYSSAELFPSY